MARSWAPGVSATARSLAEKVIFCSSRLKCVLVAERLRRAIDALPEIYRVTVIMHDIEGYTHLEIAEALGVAEGTCKSRLSLARARLRAALGNLAEEFKK